MALRIQNRKAGLVGIFRTTGWLLFLITFVAACAANGQQPERVVVGPLGATGTTESSEMTREELEDHVRRFADRYITRIALATNTISSKTEYDEHKRLMHEWNTVSQAAIVNVAIGPNAVTNLPDVMVMTRLPRLVVESHWWPVVLGDELGQEFLVTFVDLEEDIWTVADNVLTAVQQSGGMLKEVARAREAAAELRLLLQTSSELLVGIPNVTSLVNAIVKAETAVFDRVFWQLVVLIFIFFTMLFIYRLIAARGFSK